MNRRSLRLRKAPLSSAAPVGRPDIGLRCHSASLPVAVARLGLQIFQNRPQLRGFGQAYEDVSLMKTFAIAGRYNLEVRLDLLNAFNRHYLADPVTDIGSPDFGYVTGLAPASNFGTGSSPSRQVQVGVRFEF